MTRYHRFALCAVAGIVVCSAEGVAQPQPQLPPDLIVRAPRAQIDQIASRHGLTVLRAADDDDAGDVFLLRAASVADPEEQDDLLEDAEDDLEDDHEVVAVERNARLDVPEAPLVNHSTVAILETLPDRTPLLFYGTTVWTGFARQPSASALRLDESHQSATGQHVVAIIDTGVDPAHPALAGALVSGFDFTRDVTGGTEWPDLSHSTVAILEQYSNEQPARVFLVNQSAALILGNSAAAALVASPPPPAFGHGTMVAGLVRLVAPQARIMPLKAFRADGSATVFDVLRAIYYAVDHGARVINMSFSVDHASPELMRALNYVAEQGVIAVASAGNKGEETVVFPAGFRHVLGAGSTAPSGSRSTFSNYGRGLVRVWAPGESLLSPYPGGGYASVSGTSFSAAFVAGGAALLTHADDTIGPTEVERLLVPDSSSGGAFLDPLRALTVIGGGTPPPPPPLPPPPPPFLLALDSRAIQAGVAPNSFTSSDVNADLAQIGQRTPLRFDDARLGAVVELPTGAVGAEGWLAFRSVPASWTSAGPTADGLRNFVGRPIQSFPHVVGPGLGSPDATGNREALLDDVAGVTPLRATGLRLLIGSRVCAVVFPSSISVNYGPVRASLKGATVGTVAFEVIALTTQTQSTLPRATVRMLDPRGVCESVVPFTAAPVPASSSVPFDVVP